jgi:KDO2-lipid IV(A) lauroyltransferase
MGRTKDRYKTGNLGQYAPRFWLSWLIVGLSWLIAKIPNTAQHHLARWIAARSAKSKSSRIHVIRRNIELCFPELTKTAQQALVEKNIYSSILMIFDLLAMLWGSRSSVLERGRIIGEQHFRDALASDKPLIIISGHATTFLLGLGKLTEIRPFSAVYRRMDNPVLEKHLYQRATRSFPIETIHRKEIPLMLNRLAGSGVVAILPDQDFGTKRGTFIPFFGIDTATITVIPGYAQSADANVLLLYSYREANRKYVVEVEPILENYPSGNDEADTVLWSEWLERKIRQHPEDYFWLHKRFKSRPEGEQKLY